MGRGGEGGGVSLCCGYDYKRRNSTTRRLIIVSPKNEFCTCKREIEKQLIVYHYVNKLLLFMLVR